METIANLRSVNVMRYILPLREGGSLPALAEADDSFKYVIKFKGAGHGEKALIAELLGGELARVLGFKMPELVLANFDEAFGRTEADEEIQDLLKFSEGLNLGMHFLSGAVNFDPLVMNVTASLASEIVWLDAFITNVDRSFRNTNMLIWHKELWLIDHGASFYFHHAFTNWEKQALTAFPLIKDHVLLPKANELDKANEKFKSILNESILQQLVALIPDQWLQWKETALSPQELREIYFEFLAIRLKHSESFVKQAQHERQALI